MEQTIVTCDAATGETTTTTVTLTAEEVAAIPVADPWDDYRDERDALFVRWDAKLARMADHDYPPYVANEAQINALYAQLLAAPETLPTVADGMTLIVTAEAQLQTYTTPA